MVSIIMPVHNRLDLTRQAIESLLKDPGYDDFELIVVDDCSDDERVLSYLKFLDHRVIFMRNQTHHGSCSNAGASVSQGDYLYFSDNDVYFTAGWLGTLMQHAHAFPEIGVLGADRHPWHEVDRVLHKGELKVETSWTQVGYSQLIKRDLWLEVGPYTHDPLNVYGNDDRELCDRVIAKGLLCGSVAPRLIYHCGITKTDGSAALGADIFQGQEAPDEVIYR